MALVNQNLVSEGERHPSNKLSKINQSAPAIGLEYFGYQQTFTKFFPKLVQRYALDVLDWLEED